MSLVDTSLDCAAVHTRIKRKLDDFDFDDDLISDLVCVRMKKDEPNAVNSTTSANQSPPPQHNQFHNSTQQQFLPRPDPSSSSSSASSSSSTSAQSVNFPLSFSNRVQFFVRLLSESNTLVLIGNPEDSVKSIHEKIYAITGIPVADQRLIYRGKQLQWEQSLSECSIQNDAGLQLVGRMRSTNHPHAWKVIDEMVSLICRLCKDESLARDRDKSKYVKARLQTFLHDIPQEDSLAEEHLRVFMSSCSPAALVMLYMSPHKGNRECADESIRHFVNYIRSMVRKTLHGHCLLIVLEFCKLLKRAPCDDALYSLCRSCLGSMVENVANGGDGSKKVSSMSRLKGFIMVQDICKFIAELASRLEVSLDSSMESVTSLGPSLSDVRDFTAFLQPVMSTIGKQVASAGSISMPSYGGQYNVSCCGQEVKFLYGIFVPLFEKMERCLDKLEAALTVKDKREGGWDQYLALLKELNSISKLYPGAEELLWTKLRSKKVSLCYLILRFAKRVDDHKWILEHKDVTNFESRRHLVMMLLPEVKDEYEEIHEMLIDRSQLLAESFEYIARAETDTLRGGLFMEFKNEEATGPGVLREWFFLVCQAIFNPQNALFVACPNDRRRFFPNPGTSSLASSFVALS